MRSSEWTTIMFSLLPDSLFRLACLTFRLSLPLDRMPDSWFLYMQTKGRVENALKALNFSHLSIFQPGLLLRPDNTRFG
jgi:hypothetical protein